MLHNRATPNAIITQIMSKANGIGVSKKAEKSQSHTKGQNGQKISTKAHSISSMQNLRTVTTQYVNFVNDTCAGKPLKNINNKSMREFIKYKIENGISLPTANTYISALGKMSDNLNELNIQTTSRESITSFRQDLIKEHKQSLQSPKVDRSNQYPIEIVIQMYKDTPYGLSAELQYTAGLRADDAILISKKISVNADNSLHITQSKNGLNYDTKPLNENLIERVREAIKSGYMVDYGTYKDSLKEVVLSKEEKWQGTHSLRYDYAQQEKANGISLAQISITLGHSRERITLDYLPKVWHR